jgi:transcriptional regulator with XRE-family HTH domain
MRQFPGGELAAASCPPIVAQSVFHPAGVGEAAINIVTATPLGQLLKEWRARRGLSQLDLAVTARTTQRHLSFIESGRAAPSREMVLRLAATMDVPLRQQNNLLLAAGYAPVWHERDLSMPEMAAVSRALDHMLTQQEPFPAFVVDRRWNLLRANRGAAHLSELLTGPSASSAHDDDEPVNLAIALVSPDGLRPLIVNWQEVALYFLRGVQSDAQADGTEETAALLRRLLSFPGVPDLAQAVSPEEEPTRPVVPIHFRSGSIDLRLFTTIATLGTPREITAQEIRIECFFPIDEATTQLFRRAAAAETARRAGV